MEYRGLSTDTKPRKASNGSMFVEMDTQKVFFYDAENKRWIATQDGTVEDVPEEPVKEPIAYSYNGIILPSLPEWDKETYPYAVMVYDTNKVRLVVASVPFVARETEYSWVDVYMNAGTKFEMWYGTHDNLKYLGATTTTNTYTVSNVYEHFDSWSNHDICFDNGSVFISASEPIPIYE
jgi:hypothetical protein